MSAGFQESDLVINSHLLYKVSYLKVGQRYKKYFFSLRQASTRGGPRLEYNDNLVISLDQVLAVQPRAARSEPKKFGFQVLCNPRVHHFLCETEEDRKRWINAIRNLVFAQLGRVYPGTGTFEVEVDNTNSSRKLKLFGIYLLEITDDYLILWLPRSKQEMVRWRLVNVHNIDLRRPMGAILDRLTIELNEFSATGPGTLMFKVESGQSILDRIQECTGRRFYGFGEKMLRGKSLRKHSTSQEDLFDVRNVVSIPAQSCDTNSPSGAPVFRSFHTGTERRRSFTLSNLNAAKGAPPSPLAERKNNDGPTLPPTRRPQRPRCTSDQISTPSCQTPIRTCLSLPADTNPDIMVTSPAHVTQESGLISPINSDSESPSSEQNSPDLSWRPVSPLFPPRPPPTPPPSPRLLLQPHHSPELPDVPPFTAISPVRGFGELLPPEPPPRPRKTFTSPVSNGPHSPALSSRTHDHRPFIPPRPAATLPTTRSSSFAENSGRPPVPLPRPADTLPSYLREPENSFQYMAGESNT